MRMPTTELGQQCALRGGADTAGTKSPSAPEAAGQALRERGTGVTWAEVCDDPRLQNLAYKVEINRHGQLIMSPTRYKHSFFQAEIARLLSKSLPHGRVALETAIDCAPEGTCVADVTWASPDRFKVIIEETSCSVAPEICVEVWSPSNSAGELEMKRRLYFGRGALEVWYCDAAGHLTFFDPGGEITQSRLCPKFPGPVAI